MNLKIFAVCQFYYPENFAITPLMKQLVKMGHQVTILTGLPNAGFGRIVPEYRKVRQENIDGVKVLRVPLMARKKSKLSLISNYFSFYVNANRFIKHHKGEYDVVFTMSLSPVISMVPAIRYAKRNRLPLLMYCVDIWPESVVYTNNVKRNSWFYRLLKRWSQKIYHSSDKLLLGSPSYFEYMINEHHINQEKLHLLMQPSVNQLQTIEKADLGPGVHLVYIGNIGNFQLLSELIESLSDFKDTVLKVHIIGYGSQYEHLVKLTAKLQLESLVTFYQTLPSKIATSYALAADGLLLSLKSGGFVGKTIPNKLLLYLSCSRPIIGALEGDGYDLLKKASGGILVSPTKAGIKEGINKLLSLTEEEKNKLGQKNKLFFEKHLKVEAITEKLAHHLIELVKDNKA